MDSLGEPAPHEGPIPNEPRPRVIPNTFSVAAKVSNKEKRAASKCQTAPASSSAALSSQRRKKKADRVRETEQAETAEEARRKDFEARTRFQDGEQKAVDHYLKYDEYRNRSKKEDAPFTKRNNQFSNKSNSNYNNSNMRKCATSIAAKPSRGPQRRLSSMSDAANVVPARKQNQHADARNGLTRPMSKTLKRISWNTNRRKKRKEVEDGNNLDGNLKHAARNKGSSAVTDESAAWHLL